MMNPLSRIAGSAADRALGLPARQSAAYEVRPDVAVPMPDGVALLGDHYRPTRNNRPLPRCISSTPLPYSSA